MLPRSLNDRRAVPSLRPILDLGGWIAFIDAAEGITVDGNNIVTGVADQSGNGNTVVVNGSITRSKTGWRGIAPAFVWDGPTTQRLMVTISAGITPLSFLLVVDRLITPNAAQANLLTTKTLAGVYGSELIVDGSNLVSIYSGSVLESTLSIGTTPSGPLLLTATCNAASSKINNGQAQIATGNPGALASQDNWGVIGEPGTIGSHPITSAIVAVAAIRSAAAFTATELATIMRVLNGRYPGLA